MLSVWCLSYRSVIKHTLIIFFFSSNGTTQYEEESAFVQIVGTTSSAAFLKVALKHLREVTTVNLWTHSWYHLSLRVITEGSCWDQGFYMIRPSAAEECSALWLWLCVKVYCHWLVTDLNQKRFTHCHKCQVNPTDLCASSIKLRRELLDVFRTINQLSKMLLGETAQQMSWLAFVFVSSVFFCHVLVSESLSGRLLYYS